MQHSKAVAGRLAGSEEAVAGRLAGSVEGAAGRTADSVVGGRMEAFEAAEDRVEDFEAAVTGSAVVVVPF